MTRKALSTSVRSKRRLLGKSAVALLVATLFFYQQLSSLFRKDNLFYFHWELSDAFAILLLIVLLAAGSVVIRILLDSMGWQRTVKIYDHFFLLILAMLLAGEFVVQSMHGDASGAWARLCYVTLVGVIGFSLGFVGNRLVPYAKLVCLVFSPFVAIIFCQALLLETWGTKDESRNTLLVTTSSPSSVERRNVSPSQQNRFPILFVVFDSWSPAGSMENGRFLSHFTHLSELSDRSFVFSQAHSPGQTTNLSIPSIVYQTELDIENEKTGFWDPEKPIKEAESPGLFELAKQHGYQTALVGYYFPYRKIFGDHLDYNFSRSHVPKGSRISERMLLYLVRNFNYLPDPLNIWGRVYLRLNRPFYSQNWFNLNKRQLDELLWLIDNSAANTFSFVHFAFPHRPYVFRADGTYFGHSGTDERGPSDHGGYRRHLEFLDLMIGRITERLHVAGKFNKTLLIVTADHGDGEPLDPDLTRVPLIVKLPGQEKGYTVDVPFTNNRLKPLIEQVLRGEVDEEGWLSSIESSTEVYLH